MKYTIILINIEENKYTIIFNFKIQYPGRCTDKNTSRKTKSNAVIQGNEIEIECKEMKSKEKDRLREMKLEARKGIRYLIFVT